MDINLPIDLSLVASAIARVGETVTLRRLTSTKTTLSVQVPARLTGDTPEQLPSGVQQIQRLAIIADAPLVAEGWPTPPMKGDQIVRQNGLTATIEAVDSLAVGNVMAMHRCTIRGFS